MKSLHFFLAFCLLCLAPGAFSQVKLPSVIGSHMVLQQNSDAPVWGWASPGEQINIVTSWNNQSVPVTTGTNGKWFIKIKTPQAGGPYTLTIAGKNKIVLDDILIGEVWLCSGQSNMEMPMGGWPNCPTEGSAEAIAAANNPTMRLFTVKRNTSFTPLDDCSGEWVVCTPETVKSFSATGYFFGLELLKKLNVPVGLVFSSWGGTTAEAWMSNEYVSKIPQLTTAPGMIDPEHFYRSAVENDSIARVKWLASIGFESSANGPEWTNIVASGAEWLNVPVPADWSKTPIGFYEGLVQYQMTFEAPKKWAKKTTVIELGPIDEMDMVWINGKQVGKHIRPTDWPTQRKYEVPTGTLKKGTNILSVSVANTSGIGGINGQPQKIKIYLKNSPKDSIALAGIWKARKGQPIGHAEPVEWCQYCSHENTPTMLYNAMIKPLIPFAIKGAIWYQGESNRFNGMLYRTIFPDLIQNWRHDWGQGDFPFYYVQIAPYTYSDKYSTGILRESQEFAMKKLPNTGMVVTMDIGNLKNIHPANKKDVGKRLANWALAKDYGFINTVYAGPMYQSIQNAGDKLYIHFNYVFGGLTSFGEDLRCFEIAGKDRVFHPATARIEGKSVQVYSEAVKEPVAVRFGWHSTDVPNLFNILGYPAAPFRTDNWEEK